MRTFDVSGCRTIYEHEAIDAESPNEAIAAYRELHPEMTPDTVDLVGDKPEDESRDSWIWIARCESCQRDLVDGDDYAVDEDGIYVCGECNESSFQP